MKLRYLLFILVAATCISCSGGKKVIFEESISFQDEKWLRQDVKTFNIDVDNIDDCYNVFVTMRLDTSFVRGRQLPLVMNLYTDNGERRNWRSFVNLRNEEGNWLCPLEGKYLVVDQRIKEYFFFNSKGNQRLEIHHGTDRYEIYGVNQIGIRIETAELVYPD